MKFCLPPHLRRYHAHVLLARILFPVHVIQLAGDLLEVACNVVEFLVHIRLLQYLPCLLLQESNLLRDHRQLAAGSGPSELVSLMWINHDMQWKLVIVYNNPYFFARFIFTGIFHTNKIQGCYGIFGQCSTWSCLFSVTSRHSFTLLNERFDSGFLIFL